MSTHTLEPSCTRGKHARLGCGRLRGQLLSRLDRHAAGRIVRRLAKNAGIDEQISPHSLPHAAITAAPDAGCSLRDVQDFARHADLRHGCSAALQPAAPGVPLVRLQMGRTQLPLLAASMP